MAQGIMRSDLYEELYRVEDRHWWHRQKRRVIHRLIKRYCQKPGRTLDVGCGGGKLIEELNAAGWLAEGVDTAEAKKLAIKRHLKITAVNLETKNLPFPANYFRLVTCIDTLEHLSDDRRIIKEIFRVTKPNGLIIFSVPAYPWLFSYWDKMVGHFRRYTKAQLIRIVPGKPRFISYYFSFLLLPAIFIRAIKSVVRQKEKSDFTVDPLPVFAHAVVSLLGSLEQTWLKYFKIPFGLSIIGAWQKK